MAAKDRVIPALNYLTGEGISYYPSGISDGAIMVLIEDYFNTKFGNESSDDASHHNEDDGTYKKYHLWYTYYTTIPKQMKTPHNLSLVIKPSEEMDQERGR